MGFQVSIDVTTKDNGCRPIGLSFYVTSMKIRNMVQWNLFVVSSLPAFVFHCTFVCYLIAKLMDNNNV